MLAKITSKNQITIPKKIMDQLPATDYFDINFTEGIISMMPVQMSDIDLEKIREKINSLGLKQTSVKEAIKWARSK